MIFTFVKGGDDKKVARPPRLMFRDEVEEVGITFLRLPLNRAGGKGVF